MLPSSVLQLRDVTWSKMAMGMAKVQQALGESTMPEMRPSQGQQDSIRYTCKITDHLR